MVCDREIKMAVFVEVAEGNAASAGQGNPESLRGVSPRSFAITQPYVSAVAQPRKCGKIQIAVAVHVSNDWRTLPYTFLRQAVRGEGPIQFRAQKIKASPTLTTKKNKQ